MDRLECEAHGHSPKQALYLGLIGGRCWTVEIDGRSEAMLGVTPISLMDGSGCPWMLATPAVEGRARPFLEMGRAWVAEARRLFPWLENRVHAENGKAIRLLLRLGFDVASEVQTIAGQRFRKFSLIRETEGAAPPLTAPEVWS
jgi:hypothetical protein